MDKNEAITLVKGYRRLLKEYLLLERVYLFGSYAKETNREESDIDVAIVLKRIEAEFLS